MIPVPGARRPCRDSGGPALLRPSRESDRKHDGHAGMAWPSYFQRARAPRGYRPCVPVRTAAGAAAVSAWPAIRMP